MKIERKIQNNNRGMLVGPIGILSDLVNQRSTVIYTPFEH